MSRVLVAILALAMMLGQGTMVLAGTTGSMNGRVTDSAGKPVAGATITVVSPSGTSHTTSGPDGSFTFASLDPDTYVVSAEKSGFSPLSISGVSVFADQTKNLPIAFPPKVIGNATVHIGGGSSLVNSGQSTDQYTVTPAVQRAAAALGGGGALNQAYSGLAAVPGVFIPQGQGGIYQSVYIRGGDYTQLGYEFDGVPIQRAFDQYPASALSALGQQNLQVYAGSGPLDAQSNGLAGFINQVIKTGSSPNYIAGQYQLGTPTQYQKFEFEAGGATANKLFSYYLGTAGYTQNFRLVDQNDGSYLNNEFGAIYNVVASGCGTAHPSAGCYANADNPYYGGLPLGPNGFANGPVSYADNNQVRSLENVINLHFGIPHKDGSKDDIQFLVDNGTLRTQFNNSLNSYDQYKTDVVNGTALYNGTTIPNCSDASITNPGGPGQDCALFGGFTPTYVDRSIYTGPVGAVLKPSDVTSVQQYFTPNSPTHAVGGNIDPSEDDSYQNRSSIEKLQYQKNFGSTGYARIYGYSSYSDWVQDGANSDAASYIGPVSPDYELLAHTRGVALSLADQVNSKNFVQFNAGYTYASTARFNNSFYSQSPQVAYLVNSADPTSGTCYSAALAPVTCGSAAANYSLSGFGVATAPLHPSKNAPTVDTVGLSQCGGAPCEYLTVNNGVGGTYNTVRPRFSNLSLEDRIRPTSKLLIDLGVHYDDFRYDLADTTRPAGPLTNTVSTLQRQFYVNSFIASNCQDSVTLLLVSKSPTATCTGLDAAGNPIIPVTYTSKSPSVADYHAFEPRLAATYSLNPNTVLRASYSKVEQPSSTAFQQYNAAYGNIPFITNFYPIGFRSPAHTIYPEESYNEDFSIEQQFPKYNVSFSATPFFRSTNREIFNVVLDPKTQFVSGINVGKKLVDGIELEIRKGNFDQDGFAAQLSYTYTHGRLHFDKLPNGQTVVDGINTSVRSFNQFTAFCASHPTDKRCSQGAGSTFTPASSCYENVTYKDGTTGSAGYACGSAQPDETEAGNPIVSTADIANPYYNTAPQSLFSPGAFYAPYNTLPGTGLATDVSSYITPHVITLLMQYKHGPFRFTPSLQFQGGTKYGSPTSGVGVDPTSCTGTLAAGVANDPRYKGGLPAGATAGNEFDASTCTNSITAPDFQTGHFDNFGEYTEPNEITANLQMSYDLSKRFTLTATIANLYGQCFGGEKEPFTHSGPKVGCFYAAGAQPYVGNFYNPGDKFQGSAGDAYGPAVAQTSQTVYGTAVNPLNAYLGVNIKL